MLVHFILYSLKLSLNILGLTTSLHILLSIFILISVFKKSNDVLKAKEVV